MNPREHIPSSETYGEIETVKRNITQGLSDAERQRITSQAKEVPDVPSLLADREHFVPSGRFYCNNQGVVKYRSDEIQTPLGQLKFFHEYAHRIFSHTGDTTDREAVENERIAWAFALEAFQQLGGQFTPDAGESVERMLGTYEKFIQERSTCPACGATGSEYAPQRYTCGTCYTDW